MTCILDTSYSFCSVSSTKIVQNEATAELCCISEQHTTVFRYWIDQTFEWIGWMNDSKTGRHLMWFWLYLKTCIFPFSPPKYHYWTFSFLKVKKLSMHLWLQVRCPELNRVNASKCRFYMPPLQCKHTFCWYWFSLLGNNPIVSCYIHLFIRFKNLTENMMQRLIRLEINWSCKCP